MRRIVTAMVACILALGTIQAQESCTTPDYYWCATPEYYYTGLTPCNWSEYIRLNSRFTLGGGFGRRHIHEDRLVTTLSQPDPNLASTTGILYGPTATKAKGYWGFGFISYEFFAPKALYVALRGTWGGGKLRPHQNIVAMTNAAAQQAFINANGGNVNPFAALSMPELQPVPGTIEASVPVRTFSHIAHEWNVEGRIGYTWFNSCNWMMAFYTGAGYRGGRFNLIGRSLYHWVEIPFGFKGEWNPTARWRLGLDAEIGLMANGWFLPEDQIDGAWGFKRPFDNRYEWNIELPVSWAVGCDCWRALRIELVPFWQGWKTREKIVDQALTSSPVPPVSMVVTPAGPAYGIEPILDAPVYMVSSPVNFVITSAPALAAPRLISSTLGARLELQTTF